MEPTEHRLSISRRDLYLNLCVVLLFAELIFLLGIDSTGPNPDVVPLRCSLIAGSLHFCFLSVFGWCMANAMRLYQVAKKKVRCTYRDRHGLDKQEKKLWSASIATIGNGIIQRPVLHAFGRRTNNSFSTPTSHLKRRRWRPRGKVIL